MSSTRDDAVLGKIAVHYKLVSEDQLGQLIAKSKPAPGHLGEILMQQKVITGDQLKWLHSAVDTYMAKSSPSGLVPAAKPSTSSAGTGSMPASATPAGGVPRATGSAPRPAAPAKASAPPPAPSAAHTADDLPVVGGSSVDDFFSDAPAPVAAVPAPAPAAEKPLPGVPAGLAGAGVPPVQTSTARSVTAARPSRPTGTPRAGIDPELAEMLQKAIAYKASDIHIHSAAPVQIRVHGVLKELRTGLYDPADTERMVKSALNPEQRERLEKEKDLDISLVVPQLGRFRASFYKQQRGWDAVLRSVPAEPPTLESLGMPASLKNLADFHQGLVLITGPAGCGKSSTLAALVNMLNGSRSDHIITVEDPIEFVHPKKSCVINQREVGKHTRTFANALRGALREDPDILVIGELRDLETISLAITAAETGHLVLGTLHTNNAIRTINRILDAFPPKQQSQIRAMVSESLRAIVSQRLLPTADGAKRVAATEILFVKSAVSNLIREEKTFQLRSVMQTGRADGMCLLDDALADLVKSNTISKDTARRNAEEPKRFA